MLKRVALIIVTIIVVQIIGFAIYGLVTSPATQNKLTKNEVLEAFKNDPDFAKAVQKAAASAADDQNSDLQSGQQDDTSVRGDTGAQGNTGAQGATGARGILGKNGSDGAPAPVSTALPQKFNAVNAPRGTITTITANQVKSGLMIDVSASEGSNADRPKIVLPSPVTDATIQGYVLHVLAEPQTGNLSRQGASIGYPADIPAALGDFSTLSPTDLDFSDTPVTIEYEVNGQPKQVTLTQDYSSQPENILVDVFAEALAEQAAAFTSNYDVPGPGSNYVSAIVTTQGGDGASISITNPGAGDPLNLSAVTSLAGFTAYRGYDGGELGVGELNENNGIGTGFTHSWPDHPYGIDQQALTLIATANGWRSLKTPYRSEFVSYSPTLNWFLNNNSKNIGSVIHALDEEIFNIRARLDALEP